MKIAFVTVIMPYDPVISVNSAYVKNNPRLGHRREVDQWLTAFKINLNAARKNHGIPIGNVKMDIIIYRKIRRGRKPDTSNFRKLPQDLAASVLGVDDCRFYGADWPLVEEEGEDQIIFNFTWEYNNGRKPFLYNPAHKMSIGPLSPILMKRYSIKEGSVCIGFGSAYCMRCSVAPEDCPIQFNPSVYANDSCPCKTCNRDYCPCKGADEDYEERKENILIWWKARRDSVAFETEHWGR